MTIDDQEGGQAERRNWWRLAVEHSPASIVITDLAGRIEYVNPRFSQVTGYSREEVLGNNPRVLKSGEMPPEAYRELWETITSGREWHGVFHNRRKNGELFWESASISPILDPTGRITHFVAVKEDITARKLAEDALNEANSKLERRVAERTAELSAANVQLGKAARLKDEFLASVSHEFRTPLNGILAMAAALQEQVYGPVTEEQREAVEMIEEGGRHLLHLINELLDLSKIEAERLTINPSETDVEATCRSALRLVSEQAKAKRLLIELRIAPDATKVVADALRLKQMLVNLLDNAVKFSPAGRRIELDVSIDAGREEICFTVRDEGPGIAPDEIPQLFQPFVQLHGGRARHARGTGLGLALVKKMAELHGGTTAVESEVGKGSRFTVRLPWRRELETN